VEELTYTVADLSAGIAQALRHAFPDEVWVRGEIRDLSRPQSGHVYFSLVDPGEPGAAPAALLPVTLFAFDKKTVDRLLQHVGGMDLMDNGVEVRIRGRIAHYAARGTVQLRMTRIDPDYTLGRLAAERERLIQALSAEGLLDRNASLAVPPVPLRIGLVTSAGSAAEADFLDELRRSRYAWSVQVFHTAVQGAGAEAEISAGLARAAAAGPEVIALVRGGGAQTDLATFDSETVARAIAAAPVPVFTGIGHETDSTVADRVAARSFKTPTACAGALVGMVTAYLQRLDGHAARLRQSVVMRLSREDQSLGAAGHGLARATIVLFRHNEGRLGTVAWRTVRGAKAALMPAENALARAAEHIEQSAARRLGTATAETARHRARLSTAGHRRIAAAATRLAAAEARAGAHDPRRALARGWSITRDATGRLVRDPSQVEIGDDLTTVVAGGTIGSIVESVDPVSPRGARVGDEEES